MVIRDVEYTVGKTFDLAIAHRLQNHPGKCKNIHGHNYKIELHFQRKAVHTLNDDGMVLDFGSIKETIVSNFMEHYDHCLFLEQNDPLLPVIEAWSEEQKITVMSVPPTAENMAHMFLVVANNVLDGRGLIGVSVTSVCVWETETSYAIAQL